ncbi:hypothetical protein OU994_00525 [Pseudoduganella sp. SL102]|uniref:DUF6708 domain-containing protein n=1 Tax=Pseudoduganella sp. SL102 TaxID=2995154 RepID=UPI00248AB51D|nr:DUF6708 domain-containing protein [Pseudoduganella sp. SL102]WBS02823.1 hypothetical protein OU994_00525 [Pseudoduganella sp. SL102]
MTNQNIGKDYNVVSRYGKNTAASISPTAFSLVKKIYTDAIEITGVPHGTRGKLLLLGLFGIAIAGVAGNQILKDLLGSRELYLYRVIGDIFLLLIILFSLYTTAICVRLELFKPEDEPVIFDRRNNKIYRIFRIRDLSWRGVFRSWPLAIAEYDWDLVFAEHHVSVNANTSLVSRVHALIFQVRKNKNSTEIVDGFAIGSSLQMGELTVPAVWEHIRRFMEEGGDHLPAGEYVVKAQRPSSLWGSISAVGLYGENFKKWWETERSFTILALIASPIVYPVLTLLGIFIWLGYKTSTAVDWPDAIRERVGLPLEDDVERI